MSDPVSENAGFVAERPQSLDVFIIEKVVRPLAAFIPSKVKPNHITAITPLFTTLCFICAALAPWCESRNGALVFGVLAGFFCFGSMLTDHLDGMHARATGQGSKLGEILDHWVDSYSVTLLVLSLPVSMGATGPLVTIAVTSGAMVYHTQLLVHRSTGKFVYPPTGGAASAVLLAVGLAAIAVILRFVPFAPLHREIFVALVLLIMIAGQVVNVSFYFRRLKEDRQLSALFLLAYGVVALLYSLHLMPFSLVALLWIVLSFRMSGSLVLYTVTKRPYRGWDPILLVLLGLVLLSAAVPVELNLTLISTSIVVAYTLIANARDFVRITRAL